MNNFQLIENKPFQFSENYQIRIYLSGCFYLDEYQNWQSDGLLVRFFL
jgi:hypothetical protein